MNNAISKFFCLMCVSLLLTGCANGFHPLSGLGFNLHNQEFRNAYNQAVNNFESQAERGEISWVEAATKIRLADWNLAQNAHRFDTSWKFDSNDEEFHQYSISLAEMVDRGRLSVAQYRSMKLQKFNEIQARQQTLSNQMEQIRLLQQNQQILRDGQNRINRSFTCTTFGGVTTCN